MELFIGPPRLEGETQTSESTVPVLIGTIPSSQAGRELKVWLYDWKAFVRPEDLIFPDFQGKQDNEGGVRKQGQGLTISKEINSKE
jgi:hypothetical protein